MAVVVQTSFPNIQCSATDSCGLTLKFIWIQFTRRSLSIYSAKFRANRHKEHNGREASSTGIRRGDRSICRLSEALSMKASFRARTFSWWVKCGQRRWTEDPTDNVFPPLGHAQLLFYNSFIVIYSHTTQLTRLKCMMLWGFVYSQSCAVVTTINFRTFSKRSPVSLSIHFPFSPKLP